MFQALSNTLTKVFDRLRSGGTLSEEQIDIALREIRIALLEADVALSAVKSFIDGVKAKSIGQNVIKSVTPGQMMVKIVHDELVALLAVPEDKSGLNFKSEPPVNFMMVGLQGSGKTTSSAKLALYLREQYKKKVLLVSLDIYRPAAQEQLEILAKSINIDSLQIIKDQKPVEILSRAMKEAKLSGYDVVIYDTAGRTHIDEPMMSELDAVKSIVNPKEIILVLDSLTGQDAVNIAAHFNDRLDISGVILTRIDGDARGGAALSIRYVTQKPIKFLGKGEKLSELEVFHPDRIASRILGMGDVVSLVEKASENIDQEEAIKAANKLKKGLFDMGDYLAQIRTIKKMGGFSNILGMIPGVNKLLPATANISQKENMVARQEAIILSMTKQERKKPDIIAASRKKRIAAGSGTSVQEVNKLLKQFVQIRDMMKKAGRMDQKTLMRSGLGQFFS